MPSFISSIMAIYSTSVIDKAIIDYKVERQLISAWDNVNTYSVVGQHLSRSHVYSESTYLIHSCFPLVSFSNINPTSIIPWMYCRIYFTAFQWPRQESCMYLLIMLTDCDKPGLIHTITYIKLPTALAYSTWDIYSYSSTIIGDIVALSLKWGANCL